MKKLTRIKLINWHRFIDTEIETDDSMLISGENGSGKSTLLDAIQFVVTCSSGSFNKAAHDNGKRKLTGYVRCKVGKENQPYERSGAISAHVALEFYEEKTGKFFVAGAVIDSSTESQEKWVRYIINGRNMDEVIFKNDTAPLSISGFRLANKDIISNWCTTDKDAKAVMRNRFGRIEDKFFGLIPKALAFKPIDDIKKFVYTYVLDEKEVNIEALRENVHTYQELERTLENVRTRITRLQEIIKRYEATEDGFARDRMYEYYLNMVEAELIEEEIQALNKNIEKNRMRLEDTLEKQSSIHRQKKEKQEIRDSIRTELATASDFIALDEQKKRLEFLEVQSEGLSYNVEMLFEKIKAARKKHRDYLELSEEGVPEISTYDDILAKISRKGIKDSTELKDSISGAIEYKTKKSEELKRELFERSVECDRLKDERTELNYKIENLKKRKLSYPEAVNRLVDSIKVDFRKTGRQSEPKILCEVLEISDDSWRNAVEGYLNTQRFHILVEPNNFDIALGTYDRLRKEKKAYGVGLVNTKHLEEYNEAVPNSLATVVTSSDENARRYINLILGKVQMCDHYSELKKHKTSITRECMKYQNRVANAIRPEIFRTPYIGNNALKVQLQQAQERQNELTEKINDIEETLKLLRKKIEACTNDCDFDIKHGIDDLIRFGEIKEDMKSCRDNIETLEKNSNIMQKQLQLDAVEKLISELEKEGEAGLKRAGGLETEIRTDERTVKEKEEQLGNQKIICEQIIEAAGGLADQWEKEYRKQRHDKDGTIFRLNFERQRKRNQTIIERDRTEMEKSMVEYKTAHDFGAPATMDGFPDFEREYRKLTESELLVYEEKVHKAKEAAELEFREQFLSKLQENIKQAQMEFKDLNNALKDITFSSERYEFTYAPSSAYSRYYDMIMSDFNAVEGESLFAGLFHEAHKDVIEELFQRLALDREGSLKSLEELTDYRTYMDYDIKIKHSDNSVSMYSKVCEEKSGGETQTPFYVTVAASFVQLYSRNIGGEAIGLVLFDEAFNNMDDERIGGVLEFMSRLPLQIMIAAPPEKIQYISPYMKETILVMTENKVNFIEEYRINRNENKASS